MMHPSTKIGYVSEVIGFGVFAADFIPKGTITWVQDKLDRVFTPNEIVDLGKEYAHVIETYSFRNGEGDYVLCWDHGRFVNHSFRSNCLTTPYNFEIAIRDIMPGEELTDDYGYLNISSPFLAMDEGTDRKVVYPDDLVRMHPVWDDQLADAFPLINSVDQPLRNLLSPTIEDKISHVLRGEASIDSILTCFYDQKK